MSNDIQVAKKETSPLMQWLGTQSGVDPDKAWALVKRQCFSDASKATNENTALFLMTCRKYDLDPIAKQLHAFIGKNGAVQPIVGVDGWAGLANQNTDYDGCQFEDIKDEKGNLEAITCRIYRKSRKFPTEVTEYLKECQGESQQWKKWPARNLRHKAFIQCARLAFSFSGIIDDDEARRYQECEVSQPKNAREASLAALEAIDVTPIETGKVETKQEDIKPAQEPVAPKTKKQIQAEVREPEKQAGKPHLSGEITCPATLPTNIPVAPPVENSPQKPADKKQEKSTTAQSEIETFTGTAARLKKDGERFNVRFKETTEEFYATNEQAKVIKAKHEAKQQITISFVSNKELENIIQAVS